MVEETHQKQKQSLRTMHHSKPHAALLASPGMGHLIPVLELAKRLVTEHGFQATIFVVATDESTTSSLLQSPQPNLTITTLPTPDISSLIGPDTDIVTKLVVMMHESVPNLRSAVSRLKVRPVALIVDIFGTDAFTLAEEMRMLKYVFCTSNAWFLAATVYAPAMEKSQENEHTEQKKPLRIPGCKPVRFDDTLEIYHEGNSQMLEGYKKMAKEIANADGILVNTWEDLETVSLAALRNPQMLKSALNAKVYPIGPLTRPVGREAGADLQSLKEPGDVTGWLDMQPKDSVIYVSFGSGGTLSSMQMTELARGLEMSGQRFVWVVRPPVDNDASAAFFNLDGSVDGGVKNYLPDGFLNRTREVGLVVPTWAPQVEILAHPSIGGFLTHCGWNSTLESIVSGVPMIAWPLYAEQKMNAALLTEEIGVAVRPEETAADVVGREEIERLVRAVVAGEEGRGMRRRVRELKNSAEKALAEGGSSFESMRQVARECEISLRCMNSKGQGA